MEEGQEHFFVHFLRHEIITLNPCSETVLTNVYFKLLYLILQCKNILIIKSTQSSFYNCGLNIIHDTYFPFYILE